MVNFCKAILPGYIRCLPGLDLQPCVQKTLPFELYDHMGLQVTGEAGRRTKKECAALKQPEAEGLIWFTWYVSSYAYHRLTK